MLGLKRLHGFLEVTAAQVHNGNYAKWFGINKWYRSFALRNFDLEDMELESTNSGPTTKLPILKLGEYEIWAIRIKQYFQIQDYALWEVIENSDSWVLAPTEGYGDAIVIPAILAENFELNTVYSIFRRCNLLTKTPKDALTLIENKSKVRTSRNRPVVAKVSTNTFTSGLLPDVAALTDAVKALVLKNTTPSPTSVKAVEESCVTCGGPHSYYQCLATDGNTSGYQDNIQAYVSVAAINYNQEMLDTVL
ncbi:hypothetical protein Tco_0920378 [Tanacetum coccineum]